MPTALRAFLLCTNLLAVLPGSSGAAEPARNQAGFPPLLHFVQAYQDSASNQPPARATAESELDRLPWYAMGHSRGTPDTQVTVEQLPPRMACEEALHLAAAIQGYLKSKLHLTAIQMDAWHSFELAAEPSLEQQRELCAQLPSDATAVLDFSKRKELADKMLSIRAEYLRRTQAAGRALFLSLSPEQRAVIDAPPFSTVEAFH